MEQITALSGLMKKVSADWRKKIEVEMNQEYFQQLLKFLDQERLSGKTIYPHAAQIFEAFQLTSFENLKAVIIGQDPYHGYGQANGLSFSVQPGVPLPPSLRNIYKELKEDLGTDRGVNGCLNDWAEQGVLLLNASLTVEEGKAMSHQGIGWQRFTDAVIRKISEGKKGVVFILWGRFAGQKETLINSKKHFILKAAHPSPLSAYNGFFGSRPFSKTNDLLEKECLCPIKW